jgi:hypothetical protein
MSARRRLLSALLLYHVIAISVDAVPDPARMKPVASAAPVASDAVSRALTPVFNGLAAVVAALEPGLYRVTGPLRLLTRPYINAGLRQRWNMFTEPVVYDHYLRVDYYLAPTGTSTASRFQELVLPVGREDRVRLLHDFRDKDLINLLIAVYTPPIGPIDPALPQDDLGMVAHYFRRRFESGSDPPVRVVRTEIWYGSAPIPPPGESVAPAVLASRLDALLNYYDGPAPAVPVAAGARPGVTATERQADIVWTLAYVDGS